MGKASTMGLAAVAAFFAASPGGASEMPVFPTRNEIFTMIQAEDFVKLDKMVTEIRQSHLGFYNGWPPIHTFYGELEFSTPDDTVWSTYIDSFSEWARAFPESPTPRIALAKLYVSYAWMARGNGWSNSVTAEGWRLFKERLVKAQGLLDEAKSLKVQDPEAYYTSIIVAMGLGLPREKVDEEASRGLSIDPDFTPIYSAEADYLLPKWYGKPGEWESYAANAADKLGGDNGDILYMFIVRSVASNFGSELFNDRLVSYRRMKRGFLVSLSRFPTNTFELNSFCYFASIAGDSETAAGLFGQIGNDYNAEVWGDSKTFEYWRHWALSAPVRPGFLARNVVALEVCGIALVLLLAGLVVFLRRTSTPPPPLLDGTC